MDERYWTMDFSKRIREKVLLCFGRYLNHPSNKSCIDGKVIMDQALLKHALILKAQQTIIQLVQQRNKR